MARLPEATVAICTFNRLRLLERALSSVLGQSEREKCEVLVVDNGSTDGTEGLVRRMLAERGGGLRYVREPNPGVSHARNRALKEARGRWVAFIDDDAVPQPGWLGELLAPVRSGRQGDDVACVAGRVLLDWEGGRPPWFPERYEPLLCRYDLGGLPRVLGSDGYLLTTNALFDRRVLLALEGFRTYLGRKRGIPLGGEDNDVYARLYASGYVVFYQPGALVRHPVVRGRQTRRYLLSRLFWSGASQALLGLSQSEVQGRPYRPSRMAWLDLRALARLLLDLSSSVARGRLAGSLDFLCPVAQRLGRLAAHCRLSLGCWKGAAAP